MSREKFIIASIIPVIILCGCEQRTFSALATPTLTTTSSPVVMPTLTITVTPQPENTETPWPTLIYYLGSTNTPDPDKTSPPPQPTITAPPPRSPSFQLPDKLEIEEYPIDNEDALNIESLVSSRHPNRGGWYYWPKGGKIDGKNFLASAVAREHLYAEIHATLDDHEIFTMDCGKVTPLPTVITAWTYGQHWIIQSVCHQGFDIFWDGVSLNASKGYQSSFAFQVLGQYPFYLFKRNDRVWLSYDGQEVLLGYDEVKLSYCCMNYPPPQHHENLITFYAIKSGQLYYVAIGLFEP